MSRANKNVPPYGKLAAAREDAMATSDEGAFDVIVIGAGLAGLSSAISLSSNGFRVLTLERRRTPGGLCGTTTFDGYEFTHGCNDFGSSIVATMQELGVEIEFRRPKSIFFTAGATYRVPATLSTIGNVARHAPDILRFVRAVRSGRRTYLGEALAGLGDHGFADLLAALGGAFGAAPSDYPMAAFLNLFSKELGYGYDKMVVPIGGPGLMADRMATRLRDLGGLLQLNTSVESVDSAGVSKSVTTANATYHARYVVHSRHRLDVYPPSAKPSFAVGALHLAVPRNAPFPAQVHGLVHVPPKARVALDRMAAGELPEEFVFNIFPTDFLDQRDYRSLTAYIALPHRLEQPPPDTIERIESYLLSQLEKHVPGLTAQVRYKRFVSPRDYRESHGLCSDLVPAIVPPGFSKPDGYDERQDIYYVGNSVQPACEHACSALASGLRAARAIERRERDGAPIPAAETASSTAEELAP
ncbi:phytoene desaturase family protein [Nocardia brasiliensis]|uniref:phytoene desaturase family protein n=1 Tax=Nocardia brasiliensis TaxID=37326 RepID=UPI003D9277C0